MNPSAKLLLRMAGVIHFLAGAYVIGISTALSIFTGFTAQNIFFYIVSGLLIAIQGYFLTALNKEAERFGKIIMGYYLFLLASKYIFYKLTNGELPVITLITVGALLILCSVTMVYLLSVRSQSEIK